jgi:hypothetical protein
MNWIDNSIKEYYNWLHEKTIVTKDEQTAGIRLLRRSLVYSTIILRYTQNWTTEN